MSIETLKNALPEYAKDLKLNLGSVAAEAALTDQQRWGALVATAIASRNTAVIQAVEAEAQTKLSPEALAAAKTAAAIMAMNNIYYRFVHLAGSEDYRTMPARLRTSSARYSSSPTHRRDCSGCATVAASPRAGTRTSCCSTRRRSVPSRPISRTTCRPARCG